MVIRLREATSRKADNFEVFNLITSSISGTMSVAMVELAGNHPKSRSTKCDRAYVILRGTALVEVGEERASVEEGDVVYIPKNSVHCISGNVRYLVLNTPPFDRDSEMSD